MDLKLAIDRLTGRHVFGPGVFWSTLAFSFLAHALGSSDLATGNILAAANAIIAHNPDRLGKKLWTEEGEGEPIELFAAYNEVDEARFVVERIRQWVRDGGSLGDAAILYRSNAQSRAFEEALLSEQVPYRVYGGMRFFERAEIKDALAYLRLVANRADDAAFERAVNTPARGIGEKTLDEVRRRARHDSVALWEAARRIVDEGGLTARARNAVGGFLTLLDAIDNDVQAMTLPEKIDHALIRSGLRDHYFNESRGQLDSRLEELTLQLNEGDSPVQELEAQRQAALEHRVTADRQLAEARSLKRLDFAIRKATSLHPIPQYLWLDL